jgi:hypothetical protein
METTTLTGHQVRGRMKERGITLAQFAAEADMYETDVSAILSGHEYLGPSRRARMERAIVRLGLDRDEAPEPDSPMEHVFSIRSA